MYKDAKHDFRSTAEFEAAQKANMEKGKNLELKSDMFVADKEELERLRALIEASDLPDDEKSSALAHLDEQEKVLEVTWEKDVETPEEERKKEMETLIEKAREFIASTLKNREMLDGFKKQSGMDDSKIREGSKEQAELNAKFIEDERGMKEFDNLQEKLMENHRQVVAR